MTVSQQGDYLGTPIPVDAVFNVGDRETTLTVPIDDDDLDEADGSVTATVTAAAAAPYLAGSPAAAVVAVTDDDLPFVRLANVQIPTVTEGEFYRFRIERDGDTSVALSPRLTVISSGFNISEARPHAVDEGYVAAGVYVLLPGESSRGILDRRLVGRELSLREARRPGRAASTVHHAGSRFLPHGGAD